MRNAGIEILHQVNRSLCVGLNRLQSARNTVAAIRPGDFSHLRNEVLRAANSIRSFSPDGARDAELEKEISEHHSHLRQLSQILPIVHVELQARRGRLEAALGHLQAVAAWADASKKSF
jgi:hypothetical protein